MSVFANASWIWIESRQINQYVCFRKVFECAGDVDDTTLYISADSDFVLYINGRQVGAGQYSDWPEKKTWSSFDVSAYLLPGKNVIAVLGYWRGEDFFTYTAGEPGIIVRLGDIVTDKTWKCREHPAFQSGNIPKVTLQLGFTFCYDARKDTTWQGSDYDCSSWPGAVAVERSFPVVERPLPVLTVNPPVPAQIVQYGSLSGEPQGNSVAEIMASRKLIPKDFRTSSFPFVAESGGDSYLFIDLGNEQAGWLYFELEAAEGTILDIAHGEHLDDGRVRMHIGNRNFADRYICREGKSTFEMPFRRLGCTFLELHITEALEPVAIKIFSIRSVEPQLPVPADFASSDNQLIELRLAAMRTMRLCMHEHYEDCPWREQSLYAYDSRMQMLFGYPVWGNYDFAAASLRLLRDGERKDGLLELCAPARRMPMTIPVFTFAWVNQLWEHYLYSADPALMTESLGTLNRIIEAQYKNLDPVTGLYHIPNGHELWHFYEWTDGMHSHEYTEDFHAAFNLYYLELLKNAVRIKSSLGLDCHELTRRISGLSEALQGFWNEKTSLYAATMNCNGEFTGDYESVQALMLYHGLVPDSRASALIADILEGGKFIQMMPGSLFYLAEALFKYDVDARIGGWNLVMDRLQPMLESKAGTLWEMCEGSDAFNRAGSLCHGWTAIHAWLCHAWVLGIRPLEPGFRKFSVAPFPAGLSAVQGEVVTPAGKIKVKWQTEEGRTTLELCYPAGLQPEFCPLPEMAFDPDRDVKVTMLN